MASSTYLSYCITVTNESLLNATKAQPKLEGPFRFFQLVQHRIAKGTLATPTTSAVPRIPTEVWELVKHKLDDKALRRVERSYVAKFACPHCAGKAACGCPRTAKKWEDLLYCEECQETALDCHGVGDSKVAKACRRLLAKYGLCMPSMQFLQNAADHSDDYCPFSPDCRPDASIVLALPMTKPTSAVEAAEQPSYPTPPVSYDKFYNDAVWNVSFELPANANDRFRAFVRDFHLNVVEVHDGTLALAGTRADKAGAESARQLKQVKSLSAIQPRWKLFTTVVCNWY